MQRKQAQTQDQRTNDDETLDSPVTSLVKTATIFLDSLLVLSLFPLKLKLLFQLTYQEGRASWQRSDAFDVRKLTLERLIYKVLLLITHAFSNILKIWSLQLARTTNGFLSSFSTCDYYRGPYLLLLPSQNESLSVSYQAASH